MRYPFLIDRSRPHLRRRNEQLFKRDFRRSKPEERPEAMRDAAKYYSNAFHQPTPGLPTPSRHGRDRATFSTERITPFEAEQIVANLQSLPLKQFKLSKDDGSHDEDEDPDYWKVVSVNFASGMYGLLFQDSGDPIEVEKSVLLEFLVDSEVVS